MSEPGSNTRILVVTGLLAVAAGLAVAALLLFATGRGTETPKGPFSLGSTASLRKEIREGGPVYFADPTGRSQGLYLVLLNKQLVAVAADAGKSGCAVRWRGSKHRFEDCRGVKFAARDLDRFPLRERKGLLLVDTRSPESPVGSPAG